MNRNSKTNIAHHVQCVNVLRVVFRESRESEVRRVLLLEAEWSCPWCWSYFLKHCAYRPPASQNRSHAMCHHANRSKKLHSDRHRLYEPLIYNADTFSNCIFLGLSWPYWIGLFWEETGKSWERETGEDRETTPCRNWTSVSGATVSALAVWDMDGASSTLF